MKKLLPLLLIIVLLSGCSSDKSINISEWMFGRIGLIDTIKEKINSSPQTYSDTDIEYKNWEIFDGIKGTLNFHFDNTIIDGKVHYIWTFTAKVNDDQYNKLHDAFKNKYTELHHQFKDKDFVHCGFITDYIKNKEDNSYYSISLDYFDDKSLTIRWGTETAVLK